MNMLIDGQWVDASNGECMNIYNPGTGEVLDKVPRATVQDVERAIAAAQKGKEAMRKLTAHARYEILMRIAAPSRPVSTNWASCWRRRMASPSCRPAPRSR